MLLWFFSPFFFCSFVLFPFFWWRQAGLDYFDSFHFVSCYVLLSGSWETVTIPQQYQKIPLPAYGAAVLNGDASSHPFHSLPPPPPPPPHSHQTLFSSFGYHRLSPSSADEPPYGQGSSPLASCSRWISFFAFNVCIESFLSARPLPPSAMLCLPMCRRVRVRARGCACRRVHVCVCACRRVRAQMRVHMHVPSTAPPCQRCCSTAGPMALLLGHPQCPTSYLHHPVTPIPLFHVPHPTCTILCPTSHPHHPGIPHPSHRTPMSCIQPTPSQ